MNYIFNIPYPRPKKLSDPECDFSQEELVRIINTPDEKIKLDELLCIFQSYLPAGTYEESVYFLPIAMQYLFDQKEDNESLLRNLMIWCSTYKKELEKDMLYEQFLLSLKKIFFSITQSFCIGKDGYPLNGDFVCVLVAYTNEFSSYTSFGNKLLSDRFEKINTYVDAAWVLVLFEYLTYITCHSPYYSKDFIKWFNKKQTIFFARKLIFKECSRNQSPKQILFWGHILTQCGLL